MREYWVYMLMCSDGSYYTGVTNDINQRLREHKEGYDPNAYTFKRRPITLVCQHAFREVTDAIAAEKQIQGWSRKKKEALIEGKFDMLHALAMSTEKRERIALIESQIKNASSPCFDSQCSREPARSALRSA